MIAKHLFYLIGQPGSGKTTLLNAVLEGVPSAPLTVHGVALQVYPPHGAQFGAARTLFGGTDSLPLNVQPMALRVLKEGAFRLFVGEGDRLANGKFFDAAERLDYHVSVYFLDTPDDLAAQRRMDRGTVQNDAWVRGRQTKVRALARERHATRLDGSLGLDELVPMLRHHAVFAELRRSIG